MEVLLALALILPASFTVCFVVAVRNRGRSRAAIAHEQRETLTNEHYVRLRELEMAHEARMLGDGK